MRQFSIVPALTILFCLPRITLADGLIYQLPEDGAWARFEVEGEGIGSDGETVRITITGTQTLRSVGQKMVDNQRCRWIEMESKLTFERAGAQKGEFKELMKLLIRESHLVKGKDPREHVLKAYRGASADALRELDLKSDDSEIPGLDEIFHAPLKKMTKLPATTIKTMQKTWECEGFRGEKKMENVIFITETRTHKQAPFGVVTYRYEKERRQNNESQGMRTMKWKLIDSGKDAKSAAPNAN